jgi:PAS domain S-box-containing protein
MDRGGAFLFEREQQRGRLMVEYPRHGEHPPEGIYISLDNNPAMEHIRKTLQPLIIRDARIDPDMAYIRDLILERGIISMLIVPLAIGGQVIGTLGLDSTRELREFSPEQIELAQTIASQAAIAVQNASLFEQSVIRTRELETLFEATQAIAVTLDLDQVLLNTAHHMVFALQMDNAIISYWDNVENRLLVALDLRWGDTKPVEPETYDLLEYGARERALQNRQVLVVRADDPDLVPAEKALLEQHAVHGRIILPMVVREQAIGLIEIETTDRAHIFTAGEVRLARTLASQAAVAIDNARLQRETAAKLEELFVIQEISTALSASIEEDQVVKIVRTRVPTLIKAQSLMLALLNEDKQTINYPVAMRSNQDIKIANHPLGNDEVSFVVKRRSTLYIAGDEMEEVLRNLQIGMDITNARCFLGVPMVSSDEVVGALVVADDTNSRAFNLDDQRILTTVGAQIAVAIQNARLFARTRRFTAELEQAVQQRTEELQRERDRIDFLYRITTGLTSSLDMDMVLSRALDMMAKSVDADMGAILGIDSISDNLIYRATLNLPEKERERTLAFSQHEGLAGWVIQSQQSVIVDDVQKDPRWLHISESDDQPRSAIAALLEANEDILGVVMLYSEQPDHFNEDQLKLVTAAANQVASAMNNAELYGLIREQAERLGAMVRREQVDATKNAAIVESIADGVMVADQSGDIIQFNSAAERILALPRRQVIGSHISALAGLYTSSGGKRWFDTVQTWMADPTSYKTGDDVEVQLQLDNERFVSVILSPVNMGDQFLGTVSVFRDITREIEVDRMKSEFVATVSHELRTPMTSIKGYADLLLLGAAGPISDGQQRFLSTIKTNADRLSTLVNELLDISKIDRGAVRLNLLSTDVQEVINNAVEHLNSRIENENKDLKVELDIPDDLPKIRADYDKMSQVLANLVDNAFNYTYPGGTVTLGAVDEGHAVVMSVADTGIGIPKEKQDRVWQRFFRDEEQHLVMETSGTGLGLSIVKEYVTMHGGEIWFESEVDKGTTFYVRIPIFVGDETSEAEQTSAETAEE